MRLSVAGLLRLAKANPEALLNTTCLAPACKRSYQETALAAKQEPRCPYCGAREAFQSRYPEDPSVLP